MMCAHLLVLFRHSARVRAPLCKALLPTVECCGNSLFLKKKENLFFQLLLYHKQINKLPNHHKWLRQNRGVGCCSFDHWIEHTLRFFDAGLLELIGNSQTRVSKNGLKSPFESAPLWYSLTCHHDFVSTPCVSLHCFSGSVTDTWMKLWEKSYSTSTLPSCQLFADEYSDFYFAGLSNEIEIWTFGPEHEDNARRNVSTQGPFSSCSTAFNRMMQSSWEFLHLVDTHFFFKALHVIKKVKDICRDLHRSATSIANENLSTWLKQEYMQARTCFKVIFKLRYVTFFDFLPVSLTLSQKLQWQRTRWNITDFSWFEHIWKNSINVICFIFKPTWKSLK